jgi:hypothetical protein
MHAPMFQQRSTTSCVGVGHTNTDTKNTASDTANTQRKHRQSAHTCKHEPVYALARMHPRTCSRDNVTFAAHNIHVRPQHVVADTWGPTHARMLDDPPIYPHAIDETHIQTVLSRSSLARMPLRSAGIVIGPVLPSGKQLRGLRGEARCDLIMSLIADWKHVGSLLGGLMPD